MRDCKERIAELYAELDIGPHLGVRKAPGPGHPPSQQEVFHAYVDVDPTKVVVCRRHPMALDAIDIRKLAEAWAREGRKLVAPIIAEQQ